MQFTLKDNNWEITYVDSNGNSQSFTHPTKIRNLAKFIETNDKEIIEITEEWLNLTFISDEVTESIVNSIREEGGIFGENEATWD
jgi:hypothetical protein